MSWIEIQDSDLPMILEAVSTQLRLLNAYINKRPSDYARIERFQDLQSRLETAILEQ